MNPRIDDETKKARGTYRKDRELPKIPHDPGEKKPRRPSYLSEYAAEFWHKHFNGLWEQGWLSRMNLESFITVCKIFAHMRELEDEIVKNGRFEVIETQFTSKTVERPQWKAYEKITNDFYKWLQECGITPASERRYLLGDKKGEKGKAKETGKKPPNIMDFIKSG